MKTINRRLTALEAQRNRGPKKVACFVIRGGDDTAYQAWRKENPTGFAVIIRRNLHIDTAQPKEAQ